MKSRVFQAGFALPTAIFLLVLLAALGAFALTISASQHTGAALDVQGERAYQAARAGIEWGLFQSARNGSCATATLTFAGTTLAAFTTTVSCSTSSVNEGGVAVSVDQITATACNQPSCPNAAPGANYVERQIAVTTARP
jgi:MSHA biogenesis protein MshP